MSVFAQYRPAAFPYRFRAEILVNVLAGGTPTDKNVAEAWLKKKLGLVSSDDLIRDAVAEVMVERGVNAEEAVVVVNEQKNLNGFRRDEHGLYIEGRHVKAMLKEAASVAVAAEKLNGRGWGATNKGLRAFFAEHIFVPAERIHLYQHGGEGENVSVTEPTGVLQRFVSTWRGTGIQYEEYVDKALIRFVVEADYPFKEREWAEIWLCGERQGIGASRSQGYGTFEIVKWEPIGKHPAPRKAPKPKAGADGDEA